VPVPSDTELLSYTTRYNVRTFHSQIDLGGNRPALSNYARLPSAQSPAAIQWLPHRPDRRGNRARRQPRIQPHALGPRSVLVEQTAERIADGNLQRARRDGYDQARLPRGVQALALSDTVSGYYEWQDTLSGKQPWYFTARDGSPALTIAGIWDEWKSRETGERLKSCAMIITEPNEVVGEVHDRMPVLLAEKDFESWLVGEAGVELLKPAPNDLLQKYPVSKRVNSSRADDNDSTLTEKVELAAA
jgi:hypothetical protein